MLRSTLPAAVVAGALLLTSACSSDDGATLTDTASAGSAGSAGSAASGLGGEDLSGSTDDPLVLAAVQDYTAYAVAQVDEIVALTTTFTDAVRAGDLAGAQAAYAPSREPWERIEPLAGLVEELDGAVDTRVDDFATPEDPGFTGWHRLEYILFDLGTTEGAVEFADQLDADLQTLQAEFATLEIPAVAVPVGAAELIEEVSEGKITGEEDRYSKTDLWDFNANLEGSQAAIEALAPALEEADATLLADIEAGFADLASTLAPLRDGDGWVLYCQQDDPFPSERCTGVTVTPETIATLTAQLADLSEDVAQTAGVLGLR